MPPYCTTLSHPSPLADRSSEITSALIGKVPELSDQPGFFPGRTLPRVPVRARFSVHGTDIQELDLVEPIDCLPALCGQIRCEKIPGLPPIANNFGTRARSPSVVEHIFFSPLMSARVWQRSFNFGPRAARVRNPRLIFFSFVPRDLPKKMTHFGARSGRDSANFFVSQANNLYSRGRVAGKPPESELGVLRAQLFCLPITSSRESCVRCTSARRSTVNVSQVRKPRFSTVQPTDSTFFTGLYRNETNPISLHNKIIFR